MINYLLSWPRAIRPLVGLIALLQLFWCGALSASTQGILIKLNGPVSPASMAFIVNGLEQAEQEQAPVVVLQLDTPGGLDHSMRDIVQAILSSPIPVVTFVGPSGSRAASAGAFILYASHVAAMAPGTNLGAATPVQIGGGGNLPEPGKTSQKPAEQGDESTPSVPDQGAESAMLHKAANDAAAYIRSLAQMRERNVEWAEKFVTEAASLSAQEALDAGVIDLIANNIPDLLQQIDGRTVQVNSGTLTLQTTGLALTEIEPDWRIELLSLIANPNVAYILILLGVYGLLFEFYNPGFVLPGVIGAISLLMALYALQVLPVNYAGLALILLGIGFMVAELFAPSFGILGIGGAVAFVAGSIFLIDTEIPGYGIALPLIISVTVVTFLFFMTVIGLAIKARARPVVSGSHNLIGALGIAEESFGNRGLIRIHGELWQAQSDSPIRHGQRVCITGVDGLTLFIEPEKETI